jgi:hypothetical protein
MTIMWVTVSNKLWAPSDRQSVATNNAVARPSVHARGTLGQLAGDLMRAWKAFRGPPRGRGCDEAAENDGPAPSAISSSSFTGLALVRRRSNSACATRAASGRLSRPDVGSTSSVLSSGPRRTPDLQAIRISGEPARNALAAAAATTHTHQGQRPRTPTACCFDRTSPSTTPRHVRHGIMECLVRFKLMGSLRVFVAREDTFLAPVVHMIRRRCTK